MITNNPINEQKQSHLYNDVATISDQAMEDLTVPEEIETWAFDEIQDLLSTSPGHHDIDFDYGWDDSIPIDQTHTFLD